MKPKHLMIADVYTSHL